MNQTTSPIRRLTASLLVGAVIVTACSKGNDTAAPANTAGVVPQAAAATLPPPPPPQGQPPPPTEDAAAWTPEALDEVLAPIALYPDAILAQVLTASTNAQEVLDAGNWLLQNQTLKEDALTKAAAEAQFSPSVQALVHFPTVVDMMCQELDWTKQLGDAFSADQAAVLASVQRLRKQAKDAGNLVSNPQMKVETTEQNGKEVIVVQPANPQVIYVPQYNPSEAYAPAPAAAPAATTTTTTTESSGISTETAVIGGLLAFGAGVLVGNAFSDDDDDDYCYPNWGYGGVYYGGAPYYPRNTFVYAPNYNGYRPAGGYNRPGNYPARYNNNNFQRNSVNNINVNSNNNYMNKFDKNQNRVSNYQAKSPATGRTAAGTDRPRGSTSYAGAGAQRPGNAATGAAGARPSTGQARPSGQYAGARPSTGQAGGSQARPGASQRPSASQRPTTTQQRAVPDRGYPQTSGKRPDATASSMQRGGEFSGGGSQQASRDRAASQRGKSSMSSAPRPSSQRSGGGGGGRGGGGGGGGGGRGRGG